MRRVVIGLGLIVLMGASSVAGIVLQQVIAPIGYVTSVSAHTWLQRAYVCGVADGTGLRPDNCNSIRDAVR